MSQSPQHPYGRRLLPSLVDKIAATDPNRILYSITRTKDPENGFRDITAACFARGVNRCAWYIEKHLGCSENFRTLAFVGPQDPIYGVVILACIKTGYKALLLSPRNTVEANMSLLDETDCKTLLVPSGLLMSGIGRLVETSGTKIFDIPALQHWLNDGPEELYPFPKTFEEARLEPFVVLQTSGSTGMPKPITLTHGTLAAVDSCTQLPLLGYKDTYPSMCAGSRVYLAFPVNHSAGLTMLLPGCIFANIIIVFGPFPPTSAVIDGVHRHGDVQQSAIAPIMLADLIRTPAYLENLSRLDLIAYGGGPLPKAVGDVISSKTRLFNCMGATECGPLPSQLCAPEDWDYLNFSSALGSEFRPVTDDLYEHFIVRDKTFTPYQAIFETFPDIDEWRTKDLYAKHPFKEDYWLYQGRADDIIVFSTGQNFNPLHVEEIISARPDISATLVVGNGRPQSSLLVETISPPTNDSEREKLLDEIWEAVETANGYIPTEKLKVRREMIILTSSEKPMSRAGKGTVQRKATLELYAAEIDALYEKSGKWRSGPYQEYRDGMAELVQG